MTKWIALAVLIALAVASVAVGQAPRLRTVPMDTGVGTVPGSIVSFWINGDGHVTRWADSTEFPSAGPKGCRVSVAPDVITTGWIIPTSHAFLYGPKTTVVCDTAGTADSTMSHGLRLTHQSYIRNIRLATKTAFTGASTPACTLIFYETRFGSGLTSTRKVTSTYDVAASEYDSGFLSWPDSVWKYREGSVLSVVFGSASSLNSPMVTFEVFQTDSCN